MYFKPDIVLETKEEIARLIQKANINASATNTQVICQHRYHKDFLNIRCFFLGSARGLPPLLKILEQKFVIFLENYFPKQVTTMSFSPQFSYWLYDQTKGIPRALPIPTSVDIEKVQSWKAHSALLLFFYQELLELGILSADSPLDETLMYCLGYVDGPAMQQQMQQGKLFVDTGPVNVVSHGKYSHLLQLILIGLAQQQEMLNLSFPLNQLVSILIDPKHDFIKDTQRRNGWDYCLDLSSDNLFGPFGLTIFMLSTIAREACPRLHSYLGFSYIKKIMQQTKENYPEQDVKISTINDAITEVLKTHAQLKPAKQSYREDYSRRYEATEISEKLFHKNKRSEEFKQKAEKIRTHYYTAPEEKTPLLLS